MRDLPVQWPSAHQRAQCALSRDPVVRAALRVLAQHDRLLPQPAPDALEATVSRFALAPLDVHKRFELFVLLSVMERLDHALPQCPREDALIAAGRSEVARWELPTGMLSLHYDQSPAAGTHADTVAHYFGASASVRPDVRLRWSSSADHRELYLDAKHSLELSYLSHSHLKMHGYIADAPERFVEPGPKVVLVCPRTVVGKPRAGDAVCYVSDADCAAGGVLEAVLKVWLERVGETSRPSCGHQTWQGV
jgi:hypothetical protein